MPYLLQDYFCPFSNRTCFHRRTGEGTGFSKGIWGLSGQSLVTRVESARGDKYTEQNIVGAAPVGFRKYTVRKPDDWCWLCLLFDGLRPRSPIVWIHFSLVDHAVPPLPTPLMLNCFWITDKGPWFLGGGQESWYAAVENWGLPKTFCAVSY